MTLSAAQCEAELVGQLLKGGIEVLAIAELGFEDFFDPRCRLIWETALALHRRGGRVDVVTVFDALAEEGKEKSVGGLSGLGEYENSVVTTDNVSFYADEVRRFASKRRLCAELSTLAEKAKTEHDPMLVLEQVYARMSAIADNRRADPTITLSDAGARVLRAKDAEIDAYNRGERSLRMRTGIAEVDEVMGGLPRGKVTVLAGGTSHGKSALARTIAMNVSSAGFGVHIFSLEDDADTIGERALSDVGDVNLFTLANAPERFTPEQWKRVNAAADELYQRHRLVLLDSTARLSMSQIKIRVRKRKPANQTALVIVDYVQKLRDPAIKPGPGAKKLDVDLAMDGATELANEDDLVVLMCSQLNRDAAKEGRPPEMSDLRESGEIEQQARAIMAVYRPEKDERDPSKRADLRGKAFVRVLKNFKGGVGQAEVFFDAATATFRSFEWMKNNPQMELEAAR